MQYSKETEAFRVWFFERWAILVFGVVLPVVAGVAIYMATQTANARREALASLQVSWPFSVRFENRTLSDGDAIAVLAALRTLDDAAAHHSHPLKPIRVEILSHGRSFCLLLARDSERPDEYWVFRASDETMEWEIGRVTTTVFRGQ